MLQPLKRDEAPQNTPPVQEEQNQMPPVEVPENVNLDNPPVEEEIDYKAKFEELSGQMGNLKSLNEKTQSQNSQFVNWFEENNKKKDVHPLVSQVEGYVTKAGIEDPRLINRLVMSQDTTKMDAIDVIATGMALENPALLDDYNALVSTLRDRYTTVTKTEDPETGETKSESKYDSMSARIDMGVYLQKIKDVQGKVASQPEANAPDNSVESFLQSRQQKSTESQKQINGLFDQITAQPLKFQFMDGFEVQSTAEELASLKEGMLNAFRGADNVDPENFKAVLQAMYQNVHSQKVFNNFKNQILAERASNGDYTPDTRKQNPVPAAGGTSLERINALKKMAGKQ